jgi:prephenate dehydrogenase/chorismate mutase
MQEDKPKDEGRNGRKDNDLESSLAKSREEIKRITKTILDLANQRQKVSLEVSRDKELLGEAIVNPEVEHKLLSESLEYAKSIGLEEELAQTIVLELMRFSKVAQSGDTYGKLIRTFLENRQLKVITIVGVGRMGVWFANYFRKLSVSVILYDEKKERAEDKSKLIDAAYSDNLERAIEKSDLVIVSTPISKTPKIIRQIVEVRKCCSSPLTIIEISSVKNNIGTSGLYEELGTNNTVSLYSVHPLFGGGANPFESLSIVQSFPKDTTLLRGLFPHFTVVSLDWKQHDQLMGIFLTLPHALALTFANSIEGDKRLWIDAAGLSGPSYDHLLDLSRRLLEEDPEIYFEIESLNPNSKETLANAMRSLMKLEKVLDSRNEFVELFQRARQKIRELDDLRKGN